MMVVCYNQEEIWYADETFDSDNWTAGHVGGERMGAAVRFTDRYLPKGFLSSASR